jgi:hypothetical protein
MLARYYGNLLPRFLSPDPITRLSTDPQAWNGYSYVRNNPLRRVDFDGREDVDIIDIASKKMLDSATISSAEFLMSQMVGQKFPLLDFVWRKAVAKHASCDRGWWGKKLTRKEQDLVIRQGCVDDLGFHEQAAAREPSSGRAPRFLEDARDWRPCAVRVVSSTRPRGCRCSSMSRTSTRGTPEIRGHPSDR